MSRGIFAPAALAEYKEGEPAWRARSRCRAHPTHWWFTNDHREMTVAKAICSGCPVLGACLEFALIRPDLHGIWAATTAAERTAMRVAARGGGDSERDADRPSEKPGATPAEGARRAVARRRAGRNANACSDRPNETPPNHARGPEEGDGAPVTGGDDLIAPREAARRLGVTPNTVTRWSRAGRLPAVQTLGGHRRFRRSDIEALRAQQPCAPPAPANESERLPPLAAPVTA